MEKESGIVRTLRGVTNCPNIPDTRALWVRAPQLWESQQENRQTRLSFGRQINLASYLPGDNIAFPLEKQRPEISEGGSVSGAVALVKSNISGAASSLGPSGTVLARPIYGAVSLMEEFASGATPHSSLGHRARAGSWGLLAGATSHETEPHPRTDSLFSRDRCELIVPRASEWSLGPVSCK